MDETTKVSEQSIPDAQGGRVGDHVHQLLHLARALTHATSTSTSSDSETVPSSPPVLLGAPFGVELGGLSDLECVGWAQDLER
ncbi:hypothetical protein, partial [Arthrobacter psychrolactophilus]|uniref:hypothetical protein n=1 Tax=Arthrobacter psychrolactophilus TaxID=92442 RepID=UPI001C64AC9F